MLNINNPLFEKLFITGMSKENTIHTLNLYFNFDEVGQVYETFLQCVERGTMMGISPRLLFSDTFVFYKCMMNFVNIQIKKQLCLIRSKHPVQNSFCFTINICSVLIYRNIIFCTFVSYCTTHIFCFSSAMTVF